MEQLKTSFRADSTSSAVHQPGQQFARRMACLAHRLRLLISAAFHQEDATAPTAPTISSVNGMSNHEGEALTPTSDLRHPLTPTRGVTTLLEALYTSFREGLLSELSVVQFADTLAQTLSYGLFIVRVHFIDVASFTRQTAIEYLLGVSPLLGKLFGPISHFDGGDDPFVSIIDEIVRLVTEIDCTSVFAMISIRHQEISLLHFYEMFLAAYDPQIRRRRGIYYTPEPLVSYVVRSVDYLLHSRFACENGIANAMSCVNGESNHEADGLTPTSDPRHPLTSTRGVTTFRVAPSPHQKFDNPARHSGRVVILDPSCGTGMFLSAVIDYVREMYGQVGDEWSEYVRDELLFGLLGFELLPTPYVIAHLMLSLQLGTRGVSGITIGSEPGHVYLVDTLEEMVIPGWALGEHPIMVILGNPPYAGHSLNKGQWISELIEAYKRDCPELRKPGQAKWLSDDYVKFIRFAQWHVEQSGQGIVAFITNHAYLDNPTFRGMRRSLMQTFDEIYILDLHGNNKKRERSPDGSKDENVFNIQLGVAISIFVKYPDEFDKSTLYSDTSRLAAVDHAHLWGRREVYELDVEGRSVSGGGKYAWLAEHDLSSTDWTRLTPQSPFYLFVPQDVGYLEEYEMGWKVPDIFRPNGDPAPGIVTTHDEFAVSWTKDEAIRKVERLLSTSTEAEARQLFRLCTQNQWQYSQAKSELADDLWREEVVEVLYRPFDVRWTVFNRNVAVHRRERVMRHMLAGPNRGIALGRAGQVIDEKEWDIVFCTRHISEYNLYRRGGNNLFPLYLYDVSGNRRPNLAAAFISDFSCQLGMTWIADGYGDLVRTVGPEDVFAYMYAIFYSPTYRKRYAPFLKVDFPRLPLTSNKDLFRMLCQLGNRLVSLHLMESDISFVTSYPVSGNNSVASVRYVPSSERQGQGWINEAQYFEGVPLVAWNFHIGGYQVCSKWLKDRKGRLLTEDDLVHYQRLVAIVVGTIDLMREVDEVIEGYGGWPLR